MPSITIKGPPHGGSKGRRGLNMAGHGTVSLMQQMTQTGDCWQFTPDFAIAANETVDVTLVESHDEGDRFVLTVNKGIEP